MSDSTKETVQKIRDCFKDTAKVPATMTDSTIALIEPAGWFNPWNEYHGWQQVDKSFEGQGETVPLYTTDALTTLLQRVESAEESAVEASIRAHAWMEAHDKLQAGKPYSFPSPADKPALLQRCEKAEEERYQILLVVFGGEDAPGHAATGTLDDVKSAMKWHREMLTYTRERCEKAEAEVQRLRNELTDTIARTANANAKRLRAARNAMGEPKT